MRRLPAFLVGMVAGMLVASLCPPSAYGASKSSSYVCQDRTWQIATRPALPGTSDWLTYACKRPETTKGMTFEVRCADQLVATVAEPPDSPAPWDPFPQWFTTPGGSGCVGSLIDRRGIVLASAVSP